MLTLQILEKRWAIGSSPGATDIQEYRTAGFEMVLYNYELDGLLEDGHTYYVAVVAVNLAKMETSAVSHGKAIYKLNVCFVIVYTMLWPDLHSDIVFL